MRGSLFFLLLPLALVFFKAGVTLVKKNEGRLPASVDLSHLDGERYLSAARVRIIEGLSITSLESSHMISAGHFTNDMGSICNSYPMIEFTFASDDSVVSGEPILMKVRGQCQAGASENQTLPLEISYKKVLLEKVSDLKVKMNDKTDTELSFSNTGDSWPRSWSLRSVDFVSETSKIEIRSQDIFGFRGRLPQVRWPN